MRTMWIGAAGALALAACASNAANLQLATATAIGDNTSPDSIVVSNVQRGATTVRWDATGPAGQYSCMADDMVRRPHCTRND